MYSEFKSGEDSTSSVLAIWNNSSFCIIVSRIMLMTSYTPSINVLRLKLKCNTVEYPERTRYETLIANNSCRCKILSCGTYVIIFVALF